jgi:UDP-N-acetylmuramoyl-tripeptide--D-alanyl-D-alanine ligase
MMAHYGTYLLPDMAVITAVTSERMDVFSTIEAVAQEELAVAQFSRLAIINRDDIDGRHASYLTNGNLTTYGTSGVAEYRFITEDFTPENGHVGLLVAPDSEQPLSVTIHVAGEHNLRPAIAAATVGYKLGMNAATIVKGLSQLKPLPGRMNILKGVKQTILIDDTYRSSPLSAASALQTLYTFQVPQRVAVFGSMNNLGSDSQKEHEALGRLCDPNMLSWVVVIGDEAARYLAPIAKAQGCQVMICANALEAGAFAHKVLEANAAILFNGSGAGVYCEEALKIVLHSADDETLLVRQSSVWLAKKNALFSKFA